MSSPLTDTVSDWAVSAQRLAERAWRWLEANHSQLALPSGVPPEELDVVRHLKPVAELALAGSIGVREGATGQRGPTVAHGLVEFGWTQLGHGDVLYEIQRERPLDTIPLETYTPFVRAGRHHAKLDELLAHLASLRASRVPELAPDRVLAVVNAERLLGLATTWDLTALTARTWLGGMPEPWTADLATLYALTHTVFHLTDLGARPSGLPDRIQHYLGAWLPAWLEVYLEAGHWDLVGELLMVDLCLAEPAHPAQAWERLAAVQTPDGMLPAEAWRDARNPATLARNHYHSTVVAAIAGTLGVARRLDPHRS
jgi:hypothetical protein